MSFADKFERKWQLVGAAICIGVFGVLFSQQSTMPLLILCGVLITLSNNVLSYSFHSYQSELFPTRIRARAIGFTYAFSRISTVFASLHHRVLLRAVQRHYGRVRADRLRDADGGRYRSASSARGPAIWNWRKSRTDARRNLHRPVSEPPFDPVSSSFTAIALDRTQSPNCGTHPGRRLDRTRPDLCKSPEQPVPRFRCRATGKRSDPRFAPNDSPAVRTTAFGSRTRRGRSHPAS